MAVTGSKSTLNDRLLRRGTISQGPLHETPVPLCCSPSLARFTRFIHRRTGESEQHFRIYYQRGGNFYFLSLRKGVLSRGVRLIKIGELLVVAIMESFRAISIRKLSESRSHRVITRIVVELPYSFEIREGGGGRNDRGSIAMTYRTGEARRGGGGSYLRPGEAMAEINFSLTYDAS